MVGIKLFRLDMPPEQAARLAEQLTAVVERLPAHEGLVRPLAAGLDGATAYLVTDYVAADSIDQRLRRRVPTPIEQILPLVEQMAAALDAAAGAGFFHGALHPRDVLVSTKGVVSLTGVGVTQALEAVAWRPPFRRPYAAPERVAGRPWDAGADVFSLAVLAVELASGRRPLMPESSPTLPSLGVEDDARGDAVRRVLANALDEDASVRDRSAAHWAYRLSNAVQGAAVVQKGPAPVPAPSDAGEATEGVTEPPALEGPPALPDDDLPLRPVDVPETSASEAPPVELAMRAPAEGSGPTTRSETESLDRLKEAAARMPETPGVEDSWSRLVAAGKRVSATESLPVMPAATLPRADTGAPPLRPIREPARDAADTALGPVPRRGLSTGPLVTAVALACLALGFGGGYWAARRSAPSLAPAQPAAAVVTPPVPESSRPPEGPAVAREPARSPGPASRTPAPPPARRVAPEPSRSPTRAATGAAPRAPSPAVPAPAARPGRILVRSTPAAATVRLNGVVRGKTPLALRALPYGTYRVAIESPGFLPAERDVTLSESEPSGTATFELVVAGGAPSPPRADVSTTAPAARPVNPAEASIDLVSTPSGARAFVDDRLVGTTPMRVSGLPPGSHAIRIEQPGYGSWNGSVTAVAGRVTRLSVTLEPSR